MMTLMKKLLELIKKIFIPKKFQVLREVGVFDYEVFGQIGGIPAGRRVIVERMGDLLPDYSHPNISVVDVEKNKIETIITRQEKNGEATQWQFIMPKSDVTIIPTAKRKFRKN